jgi:hypothetical protein
MLKVKKITSPADYTPGWTQWVSYPEESITLDENFVPSVLPDPQNPVITLSNIKIEQRLTSSGNIVNYKLIQTLNNGEPEVVYNINMDIDLLKTIPAFTNQSYFGISDTVYEYYKNDALATTATSYDVKYSEFTNIFANNFVDRKKLTAGGLNGNKLPIAIFVPSVNSTINDIQFIVDVGVAQNEFYPNYTFEFEITGDVNIADADRDLTKLVSPITVTASKPTLGEDDNVTLTVTAQDTTITEIYAEPVFGFVPKTRIALTNGVGTIKVSTLGLSIGDPVRIKFGYKYFTGVAEYTNTIA